MYFSLGQKGELYRDGLERVGLVRGDWSGPLSERERETPGPCDESKSLSGTNTRSAPEIRTSGKGTVTEKWGRVEVDINKDERKASSQHPRRTPSERQTRI